MKSVYFLTYFKRSANPLARLPTGNAIARRFAVRKLIDTFLLRRRVSAAAALAASDQAIIATPLI
jgi:hypothetical protein